MKTTRNVPRSQRPTYVSGSKKSGSYTVSINGYERRGASTSTFSLEGTATFTPGDALEYRRAQAEAERAAWVAARNWIKELGELVRTEKDLTSEVSDG